MNFQIAVLLSAFSIAATVFAADGVPANSEFVVDESFDATELSDQWHVNNGSWTLVDGVLRVKEVASDKHAAAARRKVETENAVYQLRFRFVDDGKAFHFGFDPSPGQLSKQGHLFSVIVTPTGWKVMKHVDKKRPKDDPNETIAEKQTVFEKGQWYSLSVTTWDSSVTASIEGKQPLKGSHPTFGVKKPTLVFRCVGDGVEIDDVKVWREKK